MMKNRWFVNFIFIVALMFNMTAFACAIPSSLVAERLGWQVDDSHPLCRGYYKPYQGAIYQDEGIHVSATSVSLVENGRSSLHGHVVLDEHDRHITANNAYLYRDAKTQNLTRILLLGDVHYEEPDKLLVAHKADLDPRTKAGIIYQALYRLGFVSGINPLPAWGYAEQVERFPDAHLAFSKASYTTCAPTDNAWRIEAKTLTVDTITDTGVAKNALLRVKGVPVLYSPYLTFPTSKKRKSGFLLPILGYNSMGGVDFALPYYWNIAPNYDATLIPHLYSKRGMMFGGKFRYLTPHSFGVIGAHILPHDREFASFINANKSEYPELASQSSDRWSILVNDRTNITDNLALDVNIQNVSDNYFLQDFSSNLAVLTDRQLLRQGVLTYQTPHWTYTGMVQSYQTLNPINLSPIAGVYERLPELSGVGSYALPFDSDLSILMQYDQFHWAMFNQIMPEGPRFHVNPILSKTFMKPWGYLTPSLEFLATQYTVSTFGTPSTPSFNAEWYRGYVDMGLTFERHVSIADMNMTQTLEPRLFYLNVPNLNQANFPIYDSANMIFNTDQLFRTNRFSGFDRIGDANQLAYGVTSRWLSDKTGLEKLSVTVGQIYYFNNRQVQLCYAPLGQACKESPLTLGYLSPDTRFSPIASQAMLHVSKAVSLIGGYVWDTNTNHTNNAQAILHYEPEPNKIVNAGISYLVNGDTTIVAYQGIQNNALYQASASVVWPISQRYSGIGIYNYNISKGYSMLSLLGLQYDNCCWAVRLLGGQTFNSLDGNGRPGYNNNVYLQVLLKGLGSVASTDPTSTIQTFVPGYRDPFHR